MKKENTNNTIYLAPSVAVLDILPEGVLCGSIIGGDEDGDHEDWGNGGDIG